MPEQLLNATQLAALVKATTSDGKHFPLDDEPSAVALGLFYTHQNQPTKTGQFGFPLGSVNDEAVMLCASCNDAKSRGTDLFNSPTLSNGGWRLFLPEATAALATTGAGPANDGSSNPINNSPAGKALQDTSLGGLIASSNRLADNLQDPLWWRQVWFVAGGWLLIGIGTFQIIRGGLIKPVAGVVRSADNAAYDAASFHQNVVVPGRQYLKARRATRDARAAARGNKLMGLAPGARRGNEKRPLHGTKYNPNAPVVPHVPAGQRGPKPPPAKFTGKG
jgi:hypothetical protein